MTIFKSMLVTTLVVLVSAGAFFWLLGDPTQVKREEEVTVAVTWVPGKLQQTVHIRVTVGGTPYAAKNENLSPWGIVLQVPYGQDVTVTAASFHPATTRLDCMILRNKVVQPHGRDMVPGPGTVKCVSP